MPPVKKSVLTLRRNAAWYTDDINKRKRSEGSFNVVGELLDLLLIAKSMLSINSYMKLRENIILV